MDTKPDNAPVPGSLDSFGDAWAGVRIYGDKIVLNTGEEYTVAELNGLRWERNQWRTLAQALQRDLALTGKEGAIVFELDDLNAIRETLRLLDNKLPGRSMQAPAHRSARRRA